MPELPEVETIARVLREGTNSCPPLPGMTIHHADLFWERALAAPSVAEFEKRIHGQIIQDVRRRGKFLFFTLPEAFLFFHLRMSGDLWLEGEAQPSRDPTHNRLALHFVEPWRLVFNDARKFGRVWLVNDMDEVVGKLGPDPLDALFKASDLYKRLHVRHRQLKPLLMDQTFLAGIGNIYADEALHRAHLHPLTCSHDVRLEQAADLWLALHRVLNEAIQRNGTSIDWVYRGGDFQKHLRVYHRQALPCLTCGTPVQKMVVGQRGTYYCPFCQAEPG